MSNRDKDASGWRKPKYVRGRFVWKNGPHSPVIFKPDQYGKFILRTLPRRLPRKKKKRMERARVQLARKIRTGKSHIEILWQ